MCCLVCENALKWCEILQERRLNYEKFNHKVIWGGAFSLVVSVAAAFALSACGGGESKAEAFVKKEYPNAKILSFSEIQKEFGLKNKECLSEKNNVFLKTYHFVKSDSEVEVLEVWTDDKGNSKFSGTYSIDDIKIKLDSCFN